MHSAVCIIVLNICKYEYNCYEPFTNLHILSLPRSRRTKSSSLSTCGRTQPSRWLGRHLRHFFSWALGRCAEGQMSSKWSGKRIIPNCSVCQTVSQFNHSSFTADWQWFRCIYVFRKNDHIFDCPKKRWEFMLMLDSTHLSSQGLSQDLKMPVQNYNSKNSAHPDLAIHLAQTVIST